MRRSASAFVDKTFGADGKERTQTMVASVEAAMNSNLDALKWFDDATRAQAHEKLATIVNKIGYPRQVAQLRHARHRARIVPGNNLRAAEFEIAPASWPRSASRSIVHEWGMTPPTVNAYYDPSMNEMVFPAGILQPPFFNRAAARRSTTAPSAWSWGTS